MNVDLALTWPVLMMRVAIPLTVLPPSLGQPWYLLQHLYAPSLFIQLLFLILDLGLQVPELLLDLGQRSLILRLLRRNVLKLGLQGNYLLGKPCDIQVFFLERGKRRLTLGCPQVLEEMEKEVGQSWYLHLLLQAESLS